MVMHLISTPEHRVYLGNDNLLCCSHHAVQFCRDLQHHSKRQKSCCYSALFLFDPCKIMSLFEQHQTPLSLDATAFILSLSNYPTDRSTTSRSNETHVSHELRYPTARYSLVLMISFPYEVLHDRSIPRRTYSSALTIDLSASAQDTYNLPLICNCISDHREKR